MDSYSPDTHSLDDITLCDDASRDRAPSHATAQAGDVILSRGVSHMSEWMAWNARCPYSHAAIVLTPTVVLEAAAPAARLRPLSTIMSERHAALDLYRPGNADGGEPDEQQIEAAVDIGLRLVGTPFAMTRLPALALRTLSSRRFDGIVRAPDTHVAVHDLNCCELVYLVLQDAFGFVVGMRTPRDQPRPALDVSRFLEDWRTARGKADNRPTISTPIPGPAHRVPRDLTTSDLAGNARLRYIGSLLSPTSSELSARGAGISRKRSTPPRAPSGHVGGRHGAHSS